VRFLHLFKSSSITTSPKLIKQIIKDIMEIDIEYLKSPTFLIIGEKSSHYNFLANSNVDYLFLLNDKELFEYLSNEKSTRIIIHGLPVKNIFKQLYLSKIDLRSVSWINWGHGHVYGKRKLLSYWLDRFILSKFNKVIALTLEDLKIIQKSFPKANSYFLPYKSSQIEHALNKDLPVKANIGMHIMVGVSGGKPQNHIKGFRALANLNLEDCTVFSPINYNNDDKDYLHTVKKEGFDLFGKKFNPIEVLLNRDEYENFLSTIDVLILPSYKQNGLFNIYLLLFMGKKVFVPKNSNLYNSLKNLGFVIEALEEISIEKVNSSYDINTVKLNRRVMFELYNRNKKLEEWAWFYRTLYNME